MLRCLSAISTPLPGTGPRTAKPNPANTLRPQKFSATHQRAMWVVTVRGIRKAGRNAIASTAVTRENQTIKIVERTIVMQEANRSRRAARFAVRLTRVNRRHGEARQVFEILVV